MLKTIATPDYLSTTEAAKLLNVGSQTLRNWTDEGKIDAYVTEGGHRRYLEHEVRLLAFNERVKAQGREQTACYTCYAYIRRQGDTFTFIANRYECDIADIADINPDVVKVSSGPIRLRAEDMVRPDKRENVWRSLEREFVLTGEPQCDDGDENSNPMEVSVSGGDAYVHKWVHALGDTPQQAVQALLEGAERAYQTLLVNAVPVYGVRGYASADGTEYDISY
jgi:excisionase family DNA binding protein